MQKRTLITSNEQYQQKKQKMITFNYFLNEWVVDQRKKIKEIDDLLNTIKKSLILLESCLK